MKSYVRIKLVQENLALAISLWSAAQRGFITTGFLPGRSQILTSSGHITEVSTSLQLGDNTDLIRCVNNQIRGSFAVSAINTHLALSDVYANSPLEEAEPDLRAARCSLYLLYHTFNHDMLTPVWRCPVEYRQSFEVSPIGFVLDAIHLDGRELLWDDLGGLPKYLDLLEYCKQQVVSSPVSAASAFLQPRESQPEMGPATAEPGAANLPVAFSPAESEPVLAGAMVAAGLHPAASFSSQVSLPGGEPLPIGEPLLQPLEPAQLPDSDSDSAAAFVEACGVVAPEAMIIARELYDDYLTWCRETGREPLSQRSLGMRLTNLGFERKRRARGRHWWIGLGLTRG